MDPVTIGAIAGAAVAIIGAIAAGIKLVRAGNGKS
jgi:hypothetical protein